MANTVGTTTDLARKMIQSGYNLKFTLVVTKERYFVAVTDDGSGDIYSREGDGLAWANDLHELIQQAIVGADDDD